LRIRLLLKYFHNYPFSVDTKNDNFIKCKTRGPFWGQNKTVVDYITDFYAQGMLEILKIEIEKYKMVIIIKKNYN